MAQGKEHVPTAKSKKRVKQWTALGYPQSQVAEWLEISEKTLRVHYRDELDHGTSDALIEALDTLQSLVRNGDVTATIFMLKTRGNKATGGAWSWKDKDEEQSDDKVVNVNINLSKDA